MKLFGTLLLIALLFLVYCQLNKADSNQYVVMGRNAGDGVINFFRGLAGKATTTTPTTQTNTVTNNPFGGGPNPTNITDGNKVILGPAYTAVDCNSDLECQQWYKCQGCICNKGSGQCYYEKTAP